MKMKQMMRHALQCVAMAAMMTVTPSCINEDLSDCPVPADVADVEVIYRLRVADDGDFTAGGTIRSLHLGFWDTPATLFAEHLMSGDDVPADMTLRVTMPRRDYSHVAMINCDNMLDGSHTPMPDVIDDVLLTQPTITTDTIPPMTAPAYTATIEMPLSTVPAGSTATYEIVLEPRVTRMMLSVKHPATLTDVRCYVSGTKQGYYSRTGRWMENLRLVVDATRCGETEDLVDGLDTYFWFYSFPTTAEQPSRADGQDDAAWQVILRAYCADEDRTIQYTYTIPRHAYAGRVLRGIFTIDEDGHTTNDLGAGVEVDLDWEPGNDFDVEM